MSEQTAEEYAAALRAEYGTYVATEVINIGNARAFNPGDAVPVSHVKNGVVSEDQVAKVNTKAAKAVTEKES